MKYQKIEKWGRDEEKNRQTERGRREIDERSRMAKQIGREGKNMSRENERRVCVCVCV